MMKRFAKVQVPAVVVTAAMMAGTVSAQQTTGSTPAPAAAPQQTGQSLSGGQLPPVDNYVVGTAKPPQVQGSEIAELTLEQAIQIALDHNLSLQVAKLNPEIQDYAIEGARDVFIPNFTGTIGYQDTSALSNNVQEGLATTNSTTGTYNVGVNQSLPWYGGSYNASFNNRRNSSNVLNNDFPTTVTSTFSFSYTQPLWANLKIDTNRANIRTNIVQRQITDIQLLSTIENTKASVRSAYWSLKAAIEKIEINRRAEALAQQLLDNDTTQVQIGTMAQIDTAQPQAQLASAQGQTLAAQIAWQQSELTFKQLLVSGPDDPLFTKTINPVDIPNIGSEPNVNIQSAVQKALTDRTDIQQALKSLEVSDINLELSRNSTKPQFNLVSAVSSQGQGPNKIEPTLGYGGALGDLVAFNVPTWSFTGNFSYQLGMATQRAALARSQLSYDQQKANLKVTQLSVVSDVTGAGLNVQNTYKQYLAAHAASVAQLAATNAEQTKFTVGLSNNFNVVTQQNNLTADRLAELNALINYVNALADYDRKQRVGGGSSSTSVGGSTTGGSTTGGSTTGGSTTGGSL